MSDTVLKIISNNPSYIPDKLSENDCRVYLEKLFDVDCLEFLHTDRVEFVDQGENFENVVCNVCDHEVDIEYWQEKMDHAYQDRFRDMTFISPCCGSVTSLSSLHYKLPAGFAKFCVYVTNPHADLSEKDVQKLQEILKTQLKVIWARY